MKGITERVIRMLQRYKNILVPIDGSYEAELAFKKAVEVAKRNGKETKLQLVHVVDTRAFQNISSLDTAMVEQVTETARKTMDGYVKEAKEAGLENISYSVEYGAPKVIIAKDLPKELGTDLIMIGATGLNAVERLLIGSVTETNYVGGTHVDSMKGSGVFQHTGKITSTMLNATMMRVRIDSWNPWIAFKRGVFEKGTVAHDWTPSVEELRESAQGIERNLLVGTSPNWRSVATDSNDNQWWHLSTANSYTKIPISQFGNGTQFTYSVEVNNTTDHSVAPESFWLNSNGGRIRGAFTATLPILGPNSSRKYWAITDGKPSDAAYIEVDVISTNASTKGGQWISMRNEMLEVGTYAHAWTTSSGDHSGNLLIGTSDFSNPGSGKPNLDSAWVNLNSWSEVPNQKSPQNTKMYYRQNAWIGASERYWALTGTYTFSAYVHLGYLNNTGWTNGHKAALYIGDYSRRNASKAAILDKASMTISDVLTPYSWDTVSLAFEVRKPGWIAPRIELLQDGSAIIISSYKLEKGLINNPEYSESSTTLISQIQQNADGISTKVAKGDVISTINQSAESVRISAGKINIDGNTDISGTLNVKNVILQGNSGKVDLTGRE